MRDLLTHLRKQTKPILLYGTGNGADKILDLCATRGIEVQGVFASDGFVRKRQFRSFPVLSYAEAKERFGEMTVLLAFASSRPEVFENVARIAAEQELYVPDVPVYGEEQFDTAFARAHRDELCTVRAMLADELSVSVFDAVTEAKLTGSLSALMKSVTPDPDGLSTLLHPESYRLAADLGAYTGDTAERLASFAPRIERIVCLEPDPKTFARLTANVGKAPWAELHNCAAWDKEETLTFRIGGSRSTHQGGDGKRAEVKAMPLDAILAGRGCDFIKYDVEGADMEALNGSREVIRTHRPELLLSLYHRSADLFALPLALGEICRGYRFYLRRARSLPAWDLNLIALPEQ